MRWCVGVDFVAEAAAIRYPVRTNSSAVSSNLHHHHTDHDSVVKNDYNI
jgi:hypothetical protein